MSLPGVRPFERRPAVLDRDIRAVDRRLGADVLAAAAARLHRRRLLGTDRDAERRGQDGRRHRE